MPVTITKLKDGSYQVSTPNGIHAKHTTLANAKKQERLLNAIDENPNFKPRKITKSTLKKNLKSKKYG